MKNPDRNKKANIKCEYCKWRKDNRCLNQYSPKNFQIVAYWNRCKQFEWIEVKECDTDAKV